MVLEQFQYRKIMNKQTIIGYLKTILFSFLFALITTIGIIGYTLNTISVEEHIRAQQEEEKIDDETLDVMIAKSEYLKSLKPGSYSVSLKLALLYELKGDMKTAEEEYKSAINKAPYHEFKPKFEFSKFLINSKRYNEAEAVMDGIGEKPKTKLITYKGEIFESLGDKYFEQNRFDLAQQKYDKSKGRRQGGGVYFQHDDVNLNRDRKEATPRHMSPVTRHCRLTFPLYARA